MYHPYVIGFAPNMFGDPGQPGLQSPDIGSVVDVGAPDYGAGPTQVFGPMQPDFDSAAQQAADDFYPNADFGAPQVTLLPDQGYTSPSPIISDPGAIAVPGVARTVTTAPQVVGNNLYNAIMQFERQSPGLLRAIGAALTFSDIQKINSAVQMEFSASEVNYPGLMAYILDHFTPAQLFLLLDYAYGMGEKTFPVWMQNLNLRLQKQFDSIHK